MNFLLITEMRRLSTYWLHFELDYDMNYVYVEKLFETILTVCESLVLL